MTISTESYRAMVASQKAYEAFPTPEALESMKASQRAYEADRLAQKRAEQARQRRCTHEELSCRLMIQLKTVKARITEDAPPVGYCSRKRAEWLGMAASVAGGAIYVSGVGSSDKGFLAIGTLPSGEPVPNTIRSPKTILRILRKEMRRLAKWTHGLDSIEDEVEEVMAVHRDLCTKLGGVA